MGARNTDRVHISEYRSKANTISDMWKYNWRLRSVCEACGVQRQENLDAMIRLRGPGLVLWDKTGSCQRVLTMGTCQGRLLFKAKPPGASGYDFLGNSPRRPASGPQSRGEGPYIKPEEIEPTAMTAARGPSPSDPGT